MCPCISARLSPATSGAPAARLIPRVPAVLGRRPRLRSANAPVGPSPREALLRRRHKLRRAGWPPLPGERPTAKRPGMTGLHAIRLWAGGSDLLAISTALLHPRGRRIAGDRAAVVEGCGTCHRGDGDYQAEGCESGKEQVFHRIISISSRARCPAFLYGRWVYTSTMIIRRGGIGFVRRMTKSDWGKDFACPAQRPRPSSPHVRCHRSRCCRDPCRL
jgi:hypothetical protein